MNDSTIKPFLSGSNVFILPTVATILIHGVLGFLLTTNWKLFNEQDWQMVSQPKVINAHLVKIDNRSKSPQKKLKNIKSSVVVPVEPPKKVAPVSQYKISEPKKVTEVNPLELENRKEDLVDLMTLLVSEEQALQAEDENNVSVSYATAIQRKVITYWSRPPSARNGMECVISIQLVPTGEVVASRILTSSGNKAFDLSALNAVKKAGSFPELKNLSSTEFERNFRRFRLLFRPVDLRY